MLDFDANYFSSYFSYDDVDTISINTDLDLTSEETTTFSMRLYNSYHEIITDTITLNWISCV